MGEISILYDLIIISLFSIIIVYFSNKIKIPPLIGFILTGILIGPNGLNFINFAEQVDIFAEIGLILILFSVGIDFSIKKLMNLKKVIFLGGSSQILISILILLPFGLLLDYNLNQSIFLGFCIVTSSTAVILKMLINRGEIDSPHGKISLGILIFQDLAVVPMILIMPILAGSLSNIFSFSIILLLKLIGFLLYIYLSIKFIMPELIFQVSKTKIKELFLFLIIFICLVTLIISEIAGLSLAIGAFIAGLIISETEYNNETLGFVEPLRDVFGSIFFISIGMIFDPQIFFDNFNFIILTSIFIIFLKFLGASISVAILKYPLRIIFSVAIILSQLGEFSFVIAQLGVKNNIINVETFNLLIAIAIITMLSSPLLFKLVDYFHKIFTSSSIKADYFEEINENIQLKNHIIIIGFGINGRNLALAAKFANLKYIILELNPITVKIEKNKGEPIFFGDATKESILEKMSIRQAKVCVIAISDPAATRSIASIAKKLNPNIFLIARTRFIQEVEPLKNLNVDYVVPEEFETSIHIFSKVLFKYGVPTNDINEFINHIRSSNYNIFRNKNIGIPFNELKSIVEEYDIFKIKVNNQDIINKTLAEVNFRNKYELTLLAIERNKEIIPNPKADDIILKDDILILWGSKSKIDSLIQYM
jgi:CPA2 family monovalent cation:H+ antiporter-2